MNESEQTTNIHPLKGLFKVKNKPFFYIKGELRIIRNSAIRDISCEIIDKDRELPRSKIFHPTLLLYAIPTSILRTPSATSLVGILSTRVLVGMPSSTSVVGTFACVGLERGLN